MGARAGRNRADAAVGGDGEKKTAAFSMRSGPLRTIGGGVRDMASFLTTLDSFDDPRGLRHVKLTFYALKPTGPMNCEPLELTRPRRGRSGPIYAQNFEIAAVIA